MDIFYKNAVFNGRDPLYYLNKKYFSNKNKQIRNQIYMDYKINKLLNKDDRKKYKDLLKKHDEIKNSIIRNLTFYIDVSNFMLLKLDSNQSPHG